MDEPSRGVAAHAWRRWFWLWDLFFAVGYLAMLVVLFREDDATTTDHVVAVSALTAFGLWYLTFGRPRITADDPEIRGGRTYIAGAAALLLLGVAFQQSMLNLLFAFCPMAFMALPLQQAVVVVVSANLLPPVSILLEDGYEAMLRDLIPSTLFLLLFSVLLGTWITRIVAQSEDRAALIKELEESREEIGRLSREAGVAAERARLAAEIHDTLAQGFTSLVTLVQAAESELDSDTAMARKHLALAARTARENLTEARSLVAGLMPSALGTGSVDQAIRRQLERFAEESGVAVTCDIRRDRLQPEAVADGFCHVRLVLDDQHTHAPRLVPAHIARISKTTYVLATPRGFHWRRELPRTSTNDDVSGPHSLGPCRRPAPRDRRDRRGPQPRVAGVLVLHGGVLVVSGRTIHRRPSSRAS